MAGMTIQAASILDMLIGLKQSEAEAMIRASGLRIRVVSRDGKHFILKTDYRLDRVNLTVVGGVVTKAMVG